MVMIYTDGFEPYKPSKLSWMRYRMWFPVQSWWRRLLRLDRPPQRVVLGFQFRGGEWHSLDAMLITPKGVEVVDVILLNIDGKPMKFDPNTHWMAHSPEFLK